jgi:hypothetical protein
MYKIFLIIFVFIYSGYSQPATWQRVYNGPAQYKDFGNDITLSNNGHIYIVGTSQFHVSPYYRLYILNLFPNGDTNWTRILGLNNGIWGGEAFSSTLTPDNNLIITGSSAKIFTLMLDSNGNTISEKIYNNYGMSYCIRNTGNGYILCGTNQDSIVDKGFILKIDSFGDRVWQTFTNSWFRLFSIENTNDGGYIAAADYYIVRTDSTGNIVWQKFFTNYECVGIRTIEKLSNHYVVGGSGIDSINPNISGGCLLMINEDGNIIKRRLYPQYKSEVFSNMDIKNNRIILSYFHQNNGNDTCYNRIIITDTNFNLITQKFINYSGWVEIESIEATNDNHYLFTGFADYGNPLNWADVYLLKTDSLINFTPGYIDIKKISENIPKDFIVYQNYPNPFNSSTTIKYDIPKTGLVTLKIYDIFGKEIYSNNIYCTAGTHTYTFDGINLASGLYFYKIMTGDYVETKKMVLIK